ncbi:hypothetical protein BEP19_07445 [Ammoniphilus oxalaticus]|uniref:Chemotaxis protein n=1 Tax=Ammoniphilus oxalaticus TaxID=66863 RepID=A0A419SJM1_9BACL|nr:methyl-accepting chemotaxis protein [Ammoniphilus oxalaticus]RKD24231.1 hypothetical protein BEP19_07445 [Ammoniphilus oxalaticus]
MGRIFQFKSIRTKMLFGFSLVLLLTTFLGVFNFLATSNGNKQTKTIVQVDMPILSTADDLAFNTAEMLANVRGYVLSGGDSSYTNLFNGYIEESKQYRETMQTLTDSVEILQLVDRKSEWESSLVERVIDEYQKGNTEMAIENLAEMTVFSREIKNGFKDISIEQGARLIERADLIVDNGEETLVLGVVVSILVVIIGIGAAFVTSHSISNPIQTLIERMQVIAEGDLSKEPLETKAIDEIGQLYQTTNDMNYRMRDLLSEINRVSETVSNQSVELTQAASEVMAASEQIAVTMQELASGSETQADHSSELSELTDVFTAKVEEANANGLDVQQSSNDVLKMTHEGYQLMEASTKQMNLVDEIVRDAVEKVRSLDKQSERISELVSVIHQIANQTNLLALNAAIEAARAGEQGRGFAVVADEVRKLAEGVSVSVTDITEIVQSIQQETHSVTESLQTGYEQVEQGARHMMSTGKTFGEITEAVEHVVQNIDVVTTNLSDITKDSQEMNRSIQEIAAISEESAAGIEQTSASSQQTSSSMEEVTSSSSQLARLSEELNELARRFKI